MVELRKMGLFSKYHRYTKELYERNFPKNERADYGLLILHTISSNGVMYAVVIDEKCIGFTYLINDKEAIFLYYITIDEKFRGRGYGGQAIEILKKLSGDRPLFLDLELVTPLADNYTQRVLRHNFYIKHNLIDMPFDIKFNDVECNVMGTKLISFELYVRVLRRYYDFISNRYVNITKL